jgi:hypothetical protein
MEWLVFGEVVSDLLKTLNTIQRIQLVLPLPSQTKVYIYTCMREAHIISHMALVYIHNELNHQKLMRHTNLSIGP